LLWDAIGSEFGGRHELYERNYAGNHENIRLETFFAGNMGGLNEELKDLVRTCMKDYDLDGWQADDLVNSSDINVIQNRLRNRGKV
jgi:4-hydroxyphenylacetate 3-monooxygenase